jgi:Domain of unknown function (DUF4268)
MEFTLEDLLPSDQQIRSVRLHEPADVAIGLMYQHRFGQLPVLAENGEFLNKVVTFESVLQAVQSFRTLTENLQVRDVARSVRSYPADADLLATLEDIHRDDFALIANDSKLLGIVTTADLALFFREYAQDLMEIEGIESRIKDAILTLYIDDGDGLTCAIAKASDRRAQLRRKVPAAIGVYLERMGIQRPEREREADALSDAERVLGLAESNKKFEDLTFDELTSVLLLHPNAPKLSQAKDGSELRGLLERVRDVRNTLAHFRRELSPEERRIVQFAAKWLESNLPIPAIPAPLSSAVLGTVAPLQAGEADSQPEGSYALLASYLQSQLGASSTTLTFAQIEGILGKKLPRSASEYRAWWSNDPSKPQSAAWLEEGWRTTSVNMSDRRLTFVRTDDRENAYISFFANLNSHLAADPTFTWKNASPHGQSWHELASLDQLRPELAKLFAAFTRRKQLRIEVYLDSGDRDSTKAVFDGLFARKDRLEEVFGEPLQWERLDLKRACRIAVYNRAQVLTDFANLGLLEWSVRKAIRLRQVFGPEFAQR